VATPDASCSADPATVAIFLCVNIAAIIRVGAVVGETWVMGDAYRVRDIVDRAFALFVLIYGPMLLLPERAD